MEFLEFSCAFIFAELLGDLEELHGDERMVVCKGDVEVFTHKTWCSAHGRFYFQF